MFAGFLASTADLSHIYSSLFKFQLNDSIF